MAFLFCQMGPFEDAFPSFIAVAWHGSDYEVPLRYIIELVLEPPIVFAAPATNHFFFLPRGGLAWQRQRDSTQLHYRACAGASYNICGSGSRSLPLLHCGVLAWQRLRGSTQVH